MSSSEASTQRIPPFVSLGSARAFSAPAVAHNISSKQTASVADVAVAASVSRETSVASVGNVLDSIDDSSPIARELARAMGGDLLLARTNSDGTLFELVLAHQN